jgi:hypothetical protein
MGFHACEYLSYDDAQQRGIKHIDCFLSSGDVTLNFSSGNSWEMPDMAPLYVELGWVPPQAFINDVMNNKLTAGERLQTRGMSVKEKIGYLSPSTHPLPLVRNTSISEDFSNKLAQLMREAGNLGNRAQTKGIDFNNLRG